MKMSDELEKNLRARIETKRSVPGTVAVKGREFRYVLDDERMPFSKLFHELVVAGKRTATQGGVISENCEVRLPDGAKYQALSYKGDVDGWRADIEHGASALGLPLARIDGGKFVLAGGRTYDLDKCEIIFRKSP
jgi:hypothetical protein